MMATENNTASNTFCDELRLDDGQKVDGNYVVSVTASPPSAGLIIYGDLYLTRKHITVTGSAENITLPFKTPDIRIGYQDGLTRYHIRQGKRSQPLQVISKCAGSVLL
jgi:hypothetical protein